VHPYFAGPRPRAYAHRGWHTGDLDGCENTLAAFTRAAAGGFGYLELDVHASAAKCRPGARGAWWTSVDTPH